VLSSVLTRLIPRRLIGDRELSLPWENFETRSRRRELREAAERYSGAERPVVETLRAQGLEIASLDDLVYDRVDYRQFERALTDALQGTSDYAVREMLVRALTVPWAKESIRVLLDEFRDPAAPELYRWTVGNALSVIAPRHATAELIELALDERYGMSRQMIVEALGATKDPSVIEPLIRLLRQDDVQGHAAHALAVAGDTSALPALRELEDCNRDWVRREASRAIATITRRSLSGQ
jgi:HEAT repeat protein